MTHRIFQYAAYLCFLILPLVPLSTSFHPDEFGNGQWHSDYFFGDFGYYKFLVPLIVIYLLVPRISHKLLRRISLIALLILSGFSFLYSALAFALPAQDFIPSWGAILLLALLPICIARAINYWTVVKPKMAEETI